MAENCSGTLHNLYTPRGAEVRDGLGWSEYITEAIERFRGRFDVTFACHHWPRWGEDAALHHLETQRDLYRYIHDQSIRLANAGLTMEEAAEELELPASLRDEFACREYYGTVSHNVKAVFQRYLGWFDGNPAHLNPHPPVEAARRYVDYMGGAEAVLARARAVVRGGRLPLGGRGGEPRGVRRSGQRARRASCRPTRSSSSATRPSRGPGAPSTSPGALELREGVAPGGHAGRRAEPRPARRPHRRDGAARAGRADRRPAGRRQRDRARRGVHRRGRVVRAHGRPRSAQPPARPSGRGARPRCARRASPSWPWSAAW